MDRQIKEGELTTYPRKEKVHSCEVRRVVMNPSVVAALLLLLDGPPRVTTALEVNAAKGLNVLLLLPLPLLLSVPTETVASLRLCSGD